MGLNNKLMELESKGKYIHVALAGAGLMGKGMVSQMVLVNGIKPALVIDRTLQKAIETFKLAGVKDEDIEIGRNVQEINIALEKGKYVASDNISLLSEPDLIDIVVDATGNPTAGAEIALKTINDGKHIVMLNVEADMIIGPILNKKAKEKGVVYTGTAGDEPGSAKEIYDFAKISGFEILAIGKGKNNPIDYSATPNSVREKAEKSNLKPSMLAGFVDGTNTMIEMVVMANATGFKPDIRGGHGITATTDELPSLFRLKEEGGILNNYGIIDYVNGIAPGVFAIVTSKLPQVHSQMKFLKMGDGPNYILYRPYHLTSLETPISIARAVLDKEATIAPIGGQVCDTITLAKKDLKIGDRLDGIGGETVYGSIDSYEVAKKENLVPIGLINKNTIMKKNVNKGELITYDMVNLDEETLLYKLRKEQEETFK